jgi:hypothetical protein
MASTKMPRAGRYAALDPRPSLAIASPFPGRRVGSSSRFGASAFRHSGMCWGKQSARARALQSCRAAGKAIVNANQVQSGDGISSDLRAFNLKAGGACPADPKGPPGWRGLSEANFQARLAWKSGEFRSQAPPAFKLRRHWKTRPRTGLGLAISMSALFTRSMATARPLRSRSCRESA